MPTWKKVVVSGSAISQLSNDLNFVQNGQDGVIISGSFSGSFIGDGSQLSGVTSYTDADTLSYINSLNVVSGSVQVDITGTTGFATYSASAATANDNLASDLTADFTAADSALETSLQGEISDLSGSAHTQRLAIESNLGGELSSLSSSAHTQRVAIESGLSSDISSLSASAATANANLSSDLTTAYTSADSALSASAHTAREALKTAQSTAYIAADTALSASAHSQRVAIESTLQGNIDVETGRIDAILSASDADKDSFAEIVALINSVDTENDQAFAGFVTSSNARAAAIESSVTSLSSSAALANVNLASDITTAYQAADSTLQSNINSLSASAATANANLSSDLTTAYTAADSALSSSAHAQRVALASAQSTAYIAADTALSSSAHTQRLAIESGLSSDISSLSASAATANANLASDLTSDISSLSGSAHTQRIAIESGLSSDISSLSGSAHTQREALVSGINSGISSLSGSAHAQRVAIETSLDGKITTEKGRIDAILSASSADADTFAEIVTLINQVDTTNDQVFAGYATASNARFASLEATSGSHDTRITDLENFSSSLDSTFATDAQITSLSSSAHSQRVAIESGLSSDISSLSGSAHTQRLAIESSLSSDIDSLSGSAHIQREALISSLSASAAAANANLASDLTSDYEAADSALSASVAATFAALGTDFATDAELSALSSSAHTQRLAIESGLSSDITSLSSSAHTANANLSTDLTSAYTAADSALSSSAHTQRLAIESGLTSDISSLSGSAHSQRVAIETSLDGKITTEKGRIDAILSASTADADSFKEIVDLINSVDTSNDQAFAAFYTASVNRFNSLETTSGSHDGRITDLENWSSSLDSEFATDSDVTTLSSSIASTLSGLSQTLNVAGDSGTDGIDLKTETLNIDGDGGGITTSIDAATNTISLVSNGIVSSSAQTVANLVGQAIVASSFVGNGSGLTDITIAQSSTVVETFSGVTSYTVTHNFGSDNVLATVYDSNGYQIIPASVQATGANTVEITFAEATSGKVIVGQGGHIVSGSVPFSNITAKPTLISGSSQVSIDLVDGFTDFSASVDSRLDALDGTFATDADLTALSASAATANVNLSSDLTTAYEAADSALSSSAHTQRVALVSSLSASAATANSNLSTDLTSAYTAADTALSSSIATTISNLSSTLAISGSTGNSDVNLVTDDLTITGTSGEIATSVVGSTVTVGFASNPTVSGNLTVTGDLTVTGNTFEAQVTNLNVEDRFILINSGSNSGDTGIIFGGSDGTANVGSGIFWDAPANIFGFAQGIASTDTSATHTSKVGNIEESATAPAGAPTFQGAGTIHVNSSTGEIYIYS